MYSDKEIQQAFANSRADSPPSIVPLQIKAQFDSLTDLQKNYAHHISRASFLGTRIVLRQVSPESETIFDLILELNKACSGDWKNLQKQSGISDEELKHFLDYASQFLGNNGNYKSFGDSKFTPRLSETSFEALASLVPKAKELYSSLQDGPSNRIYLNPSKLEEGLLGYPDGGHVSTYYPGGVRAITKAEIEAVNKLMAEKELLPENTRLRVASDTRLQLLVASGISNPPAGEIDTIDKKVEYGPLPELGDKTLSIFYGDHREEMAKIALHMKKAALNADNDTQKEMMGRYAESFGSGSLKAFKESQKLWVKDIGPAVESNIGFIETLRDPAGVRAEWEGFVAVVNKERTKAFEKLVNMAPSKISLLPWSKDFEKDTFTPPDFTSLDVLSFATSGLPAGINIPNYDDIRQTIGFKNVSLGNVLSAKASNEPIPFIHARDLPLFNTHRDASFEVQVGVHELLGHGTGKLLQETFPGTYNFDASNPPRSPLTHAPVETHYLPGQTWSSVFGPIASSYEECRAECIAMALCPEPSILGVFGHGNGEDLGGAAGDVLYVAYLSMARAGVAALEYWDPKARKWGQAHMQARFSILRTFLGAVGPGGERFAWMEHEEGSDGGWEGLVVKVERGLIPTVGRKAVEEYLLKLHVYKSTADVESGRELYERMTSVDEMFAEKVRPAVLRAKTPRKVFVQVNTFERDGKIELKEYDATPEGMIQSWAERDV